MQRRAAAGYSVLFLVVGVVAFSLIATGAPPELTFQNPDHELQAGDDVTIDGRSYNVSSLTAEVEESDGEGGGSSIVRSATLRTVNESARQTATWANGSTVTYQNQTWTVATTNGTATLTAVVDRAAILANDSSVRNETQTVDGVEYVVRIDETGNGTLIRADRYFPEPAVETVSAGDEIRFDGRQVTVESVDLDGALLVWTAPDATEVSVADEANVTVGQTTYFAQFPDNETLVLSRNFERVAAHREAESEYATHVDGLWGVTLVSGSGLILLVALSFLPTRY